MKKKKTLLLLHLFLLLLLGFVQRNPVYCHSPRHHCCWIATSAPTKQPRPLLPLDKGYARPRVFVAHNIRTGNLWNVKLQCLQMRSWFYRSDYKRNEDKDRNILSSTWKFNINPLQSLVCPFLKEHTEKFYLSAEVNLSDSWTAETYWPSPGGSIKVSVWAAAPISQQSLGEGPTAPARWAPAAEFMAVQASGCAAMTTPEESCCVGETKIWENYCCRGPLPGSEPDLG